MAIEMTPAEMSPAEVALFALLRQRFDAPDAPVRRCEDDVSSEDFQLFATCFHPQDPEVGLAVCLGERLDWRHQQAGINILYGQVQAGRCPECGTVLYTLM